MRYLRKVLPPLNVFVSLLPTFRVEELLATINGFFRTVSNVLGSLVDAVGFAENIASGLSALSIVKPSISLFISSTNAFLADPATTAAATAASATLGNATAEAMALICAIASPTTCASTPEWAQTAQGSAVLSQSLDERPGEAAPSVSATVTVLLNELARVNVALQTPSLFWGQLGQGGIDGALQLLAQNGPASAQQALSHGGAVGTSTLAEVAIAAAPGDPLAQRAIEVLASRNSSAAAASKENAGVFGGLSTIGAWVEQFRDVISEAPGHARSLVEQSSVLDDALHTLSATLLELSHEPPPVWGDFCNGDACNGDNCNENVDCNWDAWTDVPDWPAATLNATQPRLEDVGDGSSGCEVTTLTVDLQLVLHGRVRCASKPERGVKLLVRQQDTVLRFYRYCPRQSCGDAPSADVATAAAARLTIDEVGILNVGPRASHLSRTWWHDYETLQLRRDRVTPQAVCARLSDSSSEGEVEVSLEFTAALPLIAATVVPSPLNIALGNERPASPLPMKVAPMLQCGVACAASSHTLVQQPSGGVAWNMSTHVPPELARCVHGLLRDYASCGRPKALSDAALAGCAGGPANRLAVPGWWLNRSVAEPLHMHVAVALGGRGEKAHALEDVLACNFYTDLQRASCACSSSGGVDLGRVLSSRQGLPPTAASMRCLSGAVGERRDSQADNRPADVTAVADRLRALGYLGTRRSDAQREHAARTFLCACAGVHSFERPCDDGPGTCRVDGEQCTRPTQRSTCLLAEAACARALIAPASEAHGWLRASQAAGWTKIPLLGDGYVFARGEEGAGVGSILRYGTTWLREALTVAGRLLLSLAADAAPLEVVAASGRNGGFTPGLPALHQTGLQLQLNVSSLSPATAATQVSSLVRAGFEVTKTPTP